MQEKRFTPGKGPLHIPSLPYISTQISISTGRLAARCSAFLASHLRRIFRSGGMLCFSLLSLSLQAEADDPIYIQRIAFNDTCQWDRPLIDSLLQRDGALSLPPIQEIELTLGPPVDSTQQGWEYLLLGLDESWNYIPCNANIRYTRLAGKQYLLEIRVPGEQKRQAGFIMNIAKPRSENLEDKWWFQPLLTLCLLLIPMVVLYFLALNRSRRNLRIEVVRNQIAGDLHDHVGANLGAINNLTDVLTKRHEQQAPATRSNLLEKIKIYTQDTVSSLQDTVWAINPLNDSVVELLGRMKEFALLMLHAKDITVNYRDAFQEEYPIGLDMQQRHAIFMMFKEIINNIIKHAEASEVKVDIHNDKTSLTIEVEDNGKGFDPAELHRGNGLRNFRSRAKENFIDLELDAEPGRGTRIKMVVHSLE